SACQHSERRQAEADLTGFAWPMAIVTLAKVGLAARSAAAAASVVGLVVGTVIPAPAGVAFGLGAHVVGAVPAALMLVVGLALVPAVFGADGGHGILGREAHDRARRPGGDAGPEIEGVLRQSPPRRRERRGRVGDRHLDPTAVDLDR